MICPVGTVPPFYGVGGPLRGLFAVAVVTGVGRDEFDAQIRPGHAEAVVEQEVHFHIIATGHVTVYALRCLSIHLVFMLFAGIIARLMTLHAEVVVSYVRFQFQAVWIMAVVAFNALSKHLALQKGAIPVYLLFYLSFREIRLRVG